MLDLDEMKKKIRSGGGRGGIVQLLVLDERGTTVATYG